MNKPHWFIKILILVIFLLINSSCRNNNDISTQIPITETDTLDVSPVLITQTPINTATPELAPTVIPSASPTFYSTPDNRILSNDPETDIPLEVLEDLAFLKSDGACQLPCWYNLNIGKSIRQELQSVLDTTFELQQYNIFTGIPRLTSVPDGYYLGEAYWARESYGVGLYFYIDSNTDTLHAIEAEWMFTPDSSLALTPKDVIERLGLPSYMPVRVHQSQDGSAVVNLLLYYFEKGLQFHFYGPCDVIAIDDTGSAEEIRICLDRGFNQVRLNIVEPFYHGLNELLTLQELEVPNRLIEDSIPFETAFGIDLTLLVEQSQTDDTLCFTTNYAVFTDE